MPLTPINQGDKVLSKPLQDNFTYLDGRITSTNTSLNNAVTALQSNISTLGTNISNFMPSISGQSGKFLTNNGTITSWGTVDFANKDLSNLTSAATKKFDGQWVNGNNVFLSTSKSSGSQTISLSSYLPSDSYNYEILITVHFDDGGSSYKYGTISSSIISAFVCAEVGDYSDYCINTIILPVGTNRQIAWYKSDNINNDAYVKLHGYRRIGTNS